MIGRRNRETHSRSGYSAAGGKAMSVSLIKKTKCPYELQAALVPEVGIGTAGTFDEHGRG
jgi:hypothetical protein